MSSSSYTWTPSPVIAFRLFSLREIKDATDNFDENNVVGEGKIGKVYLANVKLGPSINTVAVKLLHPNSLQNSQQFMQEIMTMSSIRHRNLVSIFGYSNESGKKIIVQEYMEKGSLSEYVKKKTPISLSWLQRIRICLDSARGLQFLHMETNEYPTGIAHGDIITGNILLGKDWVAKLLISGQVTTKGNAEYFAPEYITSGQLTKKIDVYAFGVILFQVLCLKMPWLDDSYTRTPYQDLGIWAEENVDSLIKEDISYDSFKLFTAIIGDTLKVDPNKRPNMDAVVLELEKVLKAQEERVDVAKTGQAATGRR